MKRISSSVTGILSTPKNKFAYNDYKIFLVIGSKKFNKIIFLIESEE